MAGAGSDRSLGDLTYQDIPQRIGARSVLVLPIGSIEQHGPHLPLNTDVVIAEALTARILARWGEALDLWRLPTIAVSLAREHEWAAGTLSLSLEGMTALMRDLGRTIARALPTRNLLILNGHGGNRGVLEALLRDLRAECGLNVCAFHPAALSDGKDAGRIPEIHGGRNETSIMLAVAPHLVRRERLPTNTSAQNPELISAKVLDLAVSWPWSSDDAGLSTSGIVGDPQSATVQFGEHLIDITVEAAGKTVEELIRQAGLHR